VVIKPINFSGHVGDAIVVFDESKLLPLFVASSPGILPPLKPGPATAPAAAPAAAPAPAVVLQAQVAGTAAEMLGLRSFAGAIGHQKCQIELEPFEHSGW